MSGLNYPPSATRNGGFATLQEKFLALVPKGDPSECWPWRFADGRPKDFYGILNWNDKGYRAHRIALEIHLGRHLLPKMQACHRCDNPPCVNPAHLFEGTNQDNLLDMSKKGRHPCWKGSRHPQTKLTEDDVIKIRSLHKKGQPPSYREIGLMYGMSESGIAHIVTRKKWTHVK